MFEIYKKNLDPSYYNKIIIGIPGLANQRQYIMEQYPDNKQIIFMDDDIDFIDLSFTSFSDLENFF